MQSLLSSENKNNKSAVNKLKPVSREALRENKNLGNFGLLSQTNSNQMDKFKKLMSFTLANKIDDMMERLTRIRRVWRRAKRGRNQQSKGTYFYITSYLDNRKELTGILVKND